MHVVKLVVNDSELYYTGRAGDAFVSDDIREAFTYLTHTEARMKAQRLNVSRVGAKFAAEKIGQREKA